MRWFELDKLYIKRIDIEKVRQLKNVALDISTDNLKHLIFTGRNGSGKTSLLNAISIYLNNIVSNERIEIYTHQYNSAQVALGYEKNTNEKVLEYTSRLNNAINMLKELKQGLTLEFNHTSKEILYSFKNGEFVVAYYKAEREFKAIEPKHVEKVVLLDQYKIDATPKDNFIKYIVDLKVTEALAKTANKGEQAKTIASWFEKLESLLQDIYADKSLKLIFDMDTFNFTIHQDGRDPYGFNTMSSGYAAVFDIVLDLIMRMESKTKKTFNFNLPGIVLIDEIETHLHLELQKRILPILTTIFPNIQFIISTHSPFVLNALDNVVIYDLEKKLLVNNGLTDLPYDGIVEGYFDSDKLSQELRNKFDRYKILVNKKEITDDDFAEVQKLELYLDEIPDYLALPVTTEYEMLKKNFRSRGDL